MYQPDDVDSAKARQIIAAARAKGRDALTEVEAKNVFKAYGLPVTPQPWLTAKKKQSSWLNRSATRS